MFHACYQRDECHYITALSASASRSLNYANTVLLLTTGIRTAYIFRRLGKSDESDSVSSRCLASGDIYTVGAAAVLLPDPNSVVPENPCVSDSSGTIDPSEDLLEGEGAP